MKNICFFDLKNDGHHWNYNLNVIKSKISEDNQCIYYTSNINNEKLDVLKKLNVKVKVVNDIGFGPNILSNFISLFKLLLFCRFNKVNELYIIYLDPFIIQLYLLKYIFKNKIVGTLHWYPNKLIKVRVLHRLKKYIKIIVHTEKILENLDKQANLIHYPIFHQISEDYVKSKNKNITLLYFGALRYDKGIDILLESLNYTSESFNLIICGKESTFSETFVKTKISHFNQDRFILDINYVSDEKMNMYYDVADVVVLPYREHFLGESGILIDSITKGKVIISTPISNSLEITSKFNNGEIFPYEDFILLAENIDKVVKNIDFYRQNALSAKKYYFEKHSLNKFIEKYSKV